MLSVLDFGRFVINTFSVYVLYRIIKKDFACYLAITNKIP